jgi:hypothetical protein
MESIESLVERYLYDTPFEVASKQLKTFVIKGPETFSYKDCIALNYIKREFWSIINYNDSDFNTAITKATFAFVD